MCPSKHIIRTRLCNPDSEEDAELLYQDEAGDLMLIRAVGMPKTYPVLDFCDSSNVPVDSVVILLAYFNTIPNRFDFGLEIVRECVLLMEPGSCPGKISQSSPPQEAGGVVKHSCVGLERWGGGPVILQGRVLGVHTGYRSRTGTTISTETVNAAMKAWLQIPPDVIRSTGAMMQVLPI